MGNAATIAGNNMEPSPELLHRVLVKDIGEKMLEEMFDKGFRLITVKELGDMLDGRDQTSDQSSVLIWKRYYTPEENEPLSIDIDICKRQRQNSNTLDLSFTGSSIEGGSLMMSSEKVCLSQVTTEEWSWS